MFFHSVRVSSPHKLTRNQMKEQQQQRQNNIRETMTNPMKATVPSYSMLMSTT